jgi:hypothetical protein
MQDTNIQTCIKGVITNDGQLEGILEKPMRAGYKLTIKLATASVSLMFKFGTATACGADSAMEGTLQNESLEALRPEVRF